MSDFQNKVINIASKEEAKTKTGLTKIKLVDQDGVKYSFFKKKKDGELSAPALQFKNLDLDENSIVQISWVEETYQYDGKDVTENKVTGFRETNQVIDESINDDSLVGQTAYSSLQKETRTVSPTQTYSAQKEEKDSKFWDKKAYKQCLWNYWLEQRENTDSTLNQEEMDLVWKVFNQIEQDAEKRFSNTKADDSADLLRDLSKTGRFGDVDPSEIPF